MSVHVLLYLLNDLGKGINARLVENFIAYSSGV